MQNLNEECTTVQQYISMLFDELPALHLDEEDCKHPQLLDQITNYGRKIIQLSQQSTFKYRNEHFISRQDVQQQIAVIFRLIIGEDPPKGFQRMTRQIIQKLQWERKSIINRLPQSRLVTPIDLRSEEQRSKHVLEEEKSNMRQSRQKSKNVGGKAPSVKEVLKIKSYFQGEQIVIREFYDKLSKLLEVSKVSVGSISPQSLKYSRIKNQNFSDKILDLIQLATQNNSSNISNLSYLVELLHSNISKRLKNEGIAHARVEAYLQEVRKMEEVHSYTISKILQNTSSIKSLCKQDPSLCGRHIEAIQDITQKLYGLYPTSEHFQNLSVVSKGIQENVSYGVQVNLTKTLNQKRIGTETYRLQVRLLQFIQRFEKNIKFRKSIQVKEIQKLFDNLREVIPQSKGNKQDLNYQEQFRRLIDLHQKKQKQMTQNSHKKGKKLQKRIAQLQQNSQQLENKIISNGEQWQHQKKKLQKKIDHEHSELKKMSLQKLHLEENISDMLRQIEHMKQTVRKYANEEHQKKKQLQRQREQLTQKAEISNIKLSESMQELKIEKKRISEERNIYKQKIELTEKELQEQKQLSTGLKLQLEDVINQHHKLRNQIGQMSIIYEQKIKEVQDMIQSIRELQQIKANQEKLITQLCKELTLSKERIQEQANDISKYLEKVDQLSKDNQALKKQIEHWKQEGSLNDADLKTLKEEVDKVTNAYLQSQTIIQSNRHELTRSNQEKQKLFKDKLKLNRLVEELENQINSLKTKYQAIQLSQRDMKDQFYQKCQELNRLSKENQDQKIQLLKNKRQVTQERQSRTKIEKQLRQLRQEVQSKKQVQSVEQGKSRLQFQNLRIQLRKKGQQLQKQQEIYDQKIGIMTKRIKEMEESIGQKQLLSRLMQHHSQ